MQHSKKQISDKNLTFPKPYPPQKSHPGFQKKSFYLNMQDGVKLALDLYLPKNLHTRIPTILHQTRYWRGMEFIFPLNGFFKSLDIRVLDQLRTYFVQRGYAWINADVRGTGASFGQWKFPWWQKEVSDGAEIVDWIIAQPWSNQKVGCTGISYSGTSAEFLLSNEHPNVKACVPMFSLFDVYDDIVLPGGVFLQWFVENWEILNMQLDRNKIPAQSSWFRHLIKSVSLAGDPEYLTQALQDHLQNTHIAAEARTLSFRDELSPGIREKMDSFSPHQHLEAINASQVPVYSWSGWLDGTYQHAAIKRFLSLKHPHKKLILGPWDHGGRFNIDIQQKAAFDRPGELMKFFDFYLKETENGLLEEKPVHYFTMQGGGWKTADTWPPAGAQKIPYYLQASQGLSPESPKYSSQEAFTTYQVDYSFGTGKYTRYTALTGILKTPRLYRDWQKISEKLLHFLSPPFDKETEITGHPWVKIYLATHATDGHIFVYLEDINLQEKARYVTEGQLRLIHREAFDTQGIYQDAVPVRSYLKNQKKPVVPGEVMEVQFDLLPVSYLIRKGHRLRVSISGADKDYFALIPEKAPVLKIYHTEEYPSQVILPEML